MSYTPTYPSSLGSEMKHGFMIASMKQMLGLIEQNWKPDVYMYEPEKMKKAYMLVLDFASAAYSFRMGLVNRYIDTGTRNRIISKVDHLYGTTLANYNERYLKKMTQALATNAIVESSSFRGDTIATLRKALNTYETIVYAEAGSNWFMQTDIGQSTLGFLLDLSKLCRTLTNPIVQAGRKVLKISGGLGKWILIGLGGLGALYLLHRRTK